MLDTLIDRIINDNPPTIWILETQRQLLPDAIKARMRHPTNHRPA